jgi:hypothetical protein
VVTFRVIALLDGGKPPQRLVGDVLSFAVTVMGYVKK